MSEGRRRAACFSSTATPVGGGTARDIGLRLPAICARSCALVRQFPGRWRCQLQLPAGQCGCLFNGQRPIDGCVVTPYRNVGIEEHRAEAFAEERALLEQVERLT